MFGHDNQNDTNQHEDTNAPVVNPTADNDNAQSAPPFDTSSISLTPDPVSTPVASPAFSPEEPAAPAPDPTPAPQATTPDDHLLSATGSHDDLLTLKQSALQQLSPLVDHLEQTPEEKFRTTMMMIQASDDQSLIQAAYAAAKDITDDKIRAQALLDIINEINYFTQQAHQA